ncbi:hypothetical protein CDAR_196511 [Caerostris darwini]|uniref:Uncharacterized protein n=1 Tax=Caerostris darwini TaxID=1538125 RepID=A0AAV4PVK0_9ARAC|nr:hypothetical protein CDAR_196511 [Caerostris darwini]
MVTLRNLISITFFPNRTKGASPRQSRNAPFHRLLLILAINFEMIEFLPKSTCSQPIHRRCQGEFLKIFGNRSVAVLQWSPDLNFLKSLEQKTNQVC